MPPVTGRNFQGEAKKSSNNASVYQHRERFTAAQVDVGVTILPAVNNYRYRMVDMAMIAVGANVGGATDVRIHGQRAGAPVALMTAAVASLVRSVKFGADAAANQLADGASWAELDHSTPVTAIKTGSAISGATHIDFLLTYVLERA